MEQFNIRTLHARRVAALDSTDGRSSISAGARVSLVVIPLPWEVSLVVILLVIPHGYVRIPDLPIIALNQGN